jgi:hypothetical protein
MAGNVGAVDYASKNNIIIFKMLACPAPDTTPQLPARKHLTRSREFLGVLRLSSTQGSPGDWRFPE